MPEHRTDTAATPAPDDTLRERLAEALTTLAPAYVRSAGTVKIVAEPVIDVLLPLIREHVEQARQEWLPKRLFVVGEYAAAEVDGCTCGAGDPETGHEPHCGLEPLAKIDTTEHDAELVQRERERNAAPAAIERLRELTVDAVERSGHDDLVRVSDIRAVLAGRCCDSHNRNCEPPSELCCQNCSEYAHPNYHPPGAACVLEGESP